VNFLLAFMELFLLGCGATSEYRLKIGDIAPTGPVDPNFQVESVEHHPFFFQKTRLSDLSYGIKIGTDLSSVLSQSTRLTDRQTDRQRDRRTDGHKDSFLITRPRLHSMQRGRN